MSPPAFQSRGRQADKSRSDPSYNSFYNIKKTRLSARYPFLPKKQIERKIKHLWERASAEKRATLCLTSSGTTAKSPFKGSILRGLCKKKVSVDQVLSNSGHLSDGSPASVGGTGPVCTLRSSIRNPHPQACGERNLRSSATKHVSTRRVSFYFEQSSPSRPTTRSSVQKQEAKGNAEKIRREKSKEAEVGSQGESKKRKLSLEEEKVYEFEDEGSKSGNPSVSEAVGGRMTRLKPAVREPAFDPEEYNLESMLNSKIFNGNSQSPTMTPEQENPKPPKKMRMGESAQKLASDKKTCSGRNADNLKNPMLSQGKDQVVKKRNKPKGAGKGRRDDMTSPTDDINTTQSDDKGEVPWIVSARRDSSSDEVQDDSGDDDEKEAIYAYYHKSSSDSTTPTMPSLSQDSEESLCSPHESDTMFSWNGVCFTKKNASIATDAFESQLSLVSMDAAEVMSVSTEASLSLNSPPSEFGFPGKLMTSPQLSLSPPDNKTEPVAPQNRRMHLRDGATMETPRSSRHHGLDMDEPPMVITSPASRKRKMRGQGGEDMVSVMTTRNARENNNQTPLSSKQSVASRGSSLVSSNGRNVLAETNSRPINAARKTNKSRLEKEDRVPVVKTKRSGRMPSKKGMKNGSRSEESSAAERGDDGLDLRGSRKAPQVTRNTEDLPHKDDDDTERGSKVNGEDEVFKSDGILCDLFLPNMSSQNRSFNPPSEPEFYQSCMDPVSSHLFLEENFFL